MGARLVMAASLSGPVNRIIIGATKSPAPNRIDVALFIPGLGRSVSHEPAPDLSVERSRTLAFGFPSFEKEGLEAAIISKVESNPRHTAPKEKGGVYLSEE